MTEIGKIQGVLQLHPFFDLQANGLQALENLRLRLELADEIIKQVAGATVTRDKRRAEIGGGTFEAAVAYLKEYND